MQATPVIISSRVKSAIQMRQRLGTYIPAKAPYGYKKDASAKVFIPDEKTARIVQVILSML